MGVTLVTPFLGGLRVSTSSRLLGGGLMKDFDNTEAENAEPDIKRGLSEIMRSGREDSGLSMTVLTVLSKGRDPYRLATDAHRRNAAWLTGPGKLRRWLAGSMKERKQQHPCGRIPRLREDSDTFALDGTAMVLCNEPATEGSIKMFHYCRRECTKGLEKDQARMLEKLGVKIEELIQ